MIRSEDIRVTGMTCQNCEFRVEKNLTKIKGISKVKADYVREKVKVKYNTDRVNRSKIEQTIIKCGYSIKEEDVPDESSEYIKISKSSLKTVGIAVVIIALYAVISKSGGFNNIPMIDEGLGYGMLFIVGLMTSFHCVAMCGGINLTQSIQIQNKPMTRLNKLMPSIKYNVGRVISYTLVGAVVGGLGSVVTPTGRMKGIVAIISSIFMLVMGLNMLGVKIRFINIGAINKFIFSKVGNKHKANSQFIVGMLNGLMPCGPLQAMQMYALGTGSVIKGAVSMFLFGLGTLPLMSIFGLFGMFISKELNKKMIEVSSILVLVLSVVMMGNGLSLSGFNLPDQSQVNASGQEEVQEEVQEDRKYVNINNNTVGTTSKDFYTEKDTTDKTDKTATKSEDSVQLINSTFKSNSYAPIKVKQGQPVKWDIYIDAADLNGCNNTVTIPSYNIQQRLKAGHNTIEFTPTKTGKIAYSCWMGMVRSTITVV